MTPDAIIAFVATGIVGALGFFLRVTFSSITARLDKFEGALSELLAELRVANTMGQTHGQEIALLRTRMHELSNDVHLVKVTQERCASCAAKK